MAAVTLDRFRAVLTAEVRRTLSTRVWWLLFLPVLVLALAQSLLGSILQLLVPQATDTSAILMLAGLASALTMTAIVGAAFGTLLATGDFRHRTVTLAYLTGSRGQVLAAKCVVAAVVAALYALFLVVLGPLLGGAALGGQQLPDLGRLAGLGAVGILVAALWGVLGVAVGTLVTNQAGAVALTVGYLLIGENLVAGALRAGDGSLGDPSVFARITPFLPGNAGDLAVWEPVVSSAGLGPQAQFVLEFLAGVSAPPPGWVALLVLAAWAGAGVALAAVVGARRDIT
ncbi:hypothetical protein [Pseudonocardia spirodelae]|uniref:ABC transporter permease n=1 Tax=Pseudonocardia spirodelae TaxID=3133431 RepID=A0ABU8TD67_9PSEU